MTLNVLFRADVPLRNYSLTHSTKTTSLHPRPQCRGLLCKTTKGIEMLFGVTMRTCRDPTGNVLKGAATSLALNRPHVSHRKTKSWRWSLFRIFVMHIVGLCVTMASLKCRKITRNFFDSCNALKIVT